MKLQAKNEIHAAGAWLTAKSQVFDTSAYKSQAECDLSFICVDKIDEAGLAECQKLLLRSAYFRNIDWTRMLNLRMLDLSSSKILELCTVGLEKLESLDISSTQLISLDTAHLRNLQCLIAIDSKLEYIDTAPFVNLTTLKLYNQEIMDDNVCVIDFRNLTRLETLEIEADILKKSFGTVFANVQTLAIKNWDYNLDQLQFQKLKQLTLDLSNKEIDFGSFVNLEFLDLGTGDVSAKQLNELMHLKHLRCESANINLAAFMLRNILSLSIKGSQASSINILELVSLRSLEIQQKLDTQIEFGAMAQLQELKLYGTGIQCLNVTAMKQLQTLDLDEKEANLIIDEKMPALRVLELSMPNLDSLDTKLLPKLQELYLYETAVMRLEMSFLTQLETLALEKTTLDNLVLHEFPHLREVSIIENQREMSVLELSSLPALNRLAIKDLQLKKLNLEKLNALRELELVQLKAESAAVDMLSALVRLEMCQVTANAAFGCLELDGKHSENDSAFQLRIASNAAPNLQVIKGSNTDVLNVQPHLFVQLSIDGTDGNGLSGVVDFFNVRILEIATPVQNKQLWAFRGVTNVRELKFEWALETTPDFSNLQLLERLNIAFSALRSCDFNDLTGLHSLEIRSKQLEQLKLGELPKLAYLRIVQSDIVEIEALDISGLAALRKFDCAAKLCEIKTGSHLLLREFRLRDAELDILDIGGMPVLTVLDLNNTEVSALATKQHDSLLYLDVSETSLADLDLSGMLALQYLNTGCTQISDLDLSCQQDLAYFESNSNLVALVSGFHPHLRVLRLQALQFDNLDVSQMPELVEFELTDSLVRSLQMGSQAELTWLRIVNTRITSLDLSQLRGLRYLSLQRNNISTLDTRLLSELVVFQLDEKCVDFDINAHSKLRQLQLLNAEIRCTGIAKDLRLRKLSLNVGLLDCAQQTCFANLTHLKLVGERLATLDLRYFPGLEQLDVCDHCIAELDICCATQLVICTAGAKLERFTYAPECGLRELKLAGSQLTSLDVSWMLDLEMLNLNCTQISVLRVNQHSKIWRLEIVETKITHLDLRCMQQLMLLFATGSNIRYCDFSTARELAWLRLDDTQMRFVRLHGIEQLRESILSKTVRFCDQRDVLQDCIGQQTFVAAKD